MKFCTCYQQLRVPDLHGDSDSVGDEVPRDAERGASRPGGKELSRRTQVHHQNIRLRRLSQHLQLRLLSGRGQGTAADTLDGLGGCATSEFELDYAYIRPRRVSARHCFRLSCSFVRPVRYCYHIS